MSLVSDESTTGTTGEIGSEKLDSGVESPFILKWQKHEYPGKPWPTRSVI